MTIKNLTVEDFESTITENSIVLVDFWAVMAFRDGVLVFRQAGGLPPAALEDLVNRVEALNMAEVRASLAARDAAHVTNALG